jgi:hypothetical protein
MYVHNFKIPPDLCDLIEKGNWPSTIEEQNKQNLKPILGKSEAKKVSPDDTEIILMAPPFHTIADELKDGNDWWEWGLKNVGEIEYEKAVIIADFGAGSDSPIILYYSDKEEPKVMYLKWEGNGDDIKHTWVSTHGSFKEFAIDVGLI